MLRRMGMVGELIGLCTVASHAVVCDADVWAGLVRLLGRRQVSVLCHSQRAHPEHVQPHLSRDLCLGREEAVPRKGCHYLGSLFRRAASARSFGRPAASLFVKTRSHQGTIHYNGRRDKAYVRGRS